jgi:delta24-sterol reductase
MDEHLLQTTLIATKIKNHFNSDSNKKIRFKHGSSNSTRSQSDKYEYIDVGGLNNILEINIEEKWILVEPNVPMDKLVEATLEKGLLPEVVMEFPGITVGGGIQGAGLESSSFKFGQFNDTCIEYELITSDGEIIIASKNENADIFYGISGSYGTLAIITKIKLRLISADRYVKLTYVPFSTLSGVIEALKTEVPKDNDFLEGIVFSTDCSIMIKAKFSSDAPKFQTFSKARDPWFYCHARDIAINKKEYVEYVPIWDYLFRYNRGAFWMGEYVFSLFHIPGGKIMKRLMNPVLNTRKLYEYLHVANITQRYIIQDYYYPFGAAIEYLKLNQDEFKIYPIWLCPIKATATEQKLSPHYSTDEKTLLNVGIYGQSKYFLNKGYLATNRQIELFGISRNARKMFYAHSYYPRDEFWKIYDYSWYLKLQNKYKAGKVFPEIWDKIYVSEEYKPALYGKLLIYMLKEIKKKIGL